MARRHTIDIPTQSPVRDAWAEYVEQHGDELAPIYQRVFGVPDRVVEYWPGERSPRKKNVRGY